MCFVCHVLTSPIVVRWGSASVAKSDHESDHFALISFDVSFLPPNMLEAYTQKADEPTDSSAFCVVIKCGLFIWLRLARAQREIVIFQGAATGGFDSPDASHRFLEDPNYRFPCDFTLALKRQSASQNALKQTIC